MKKIILIFGLLLSMNAFSNNALADGMGLCNGCSPFQKMEKAREVALNENQTFGFVHIGDSYSQSVSSFGLFTATPNFGEELPGQTLTTKPGIPEVYAYALQSSPASAISYFNQYWIFRESLVNDSNFGNGSQLVYKLLLPIITPQGEVIDSAYDFVGRPDMFNLLVDHINADPSFSILATEAWNLVTTLFRELANANPVPISIKFPDGSQITIMSTGFDSTGKLRYEIVWEESTDGIGNLISSLVNQIGTTIIIPDTPAGDDILDELYNVNNLVIIEGAGTFGGSNSNGGSYLSCQSEIREGDDGIEEIVLRCRSIPL